MRRHSSGPSRWGIIQSEIKSGASPLRTICHACSPSGAIAGFMAHSLERSAQVQRRRRLVLGDQDFHLWTPATTRVVRVRSVPVPTRHRSRAGRRAPPLKSHRRLRWSPSSVHNGGQIVGPDRPADPLQRMCVGGPASANRQTRRAVSIPVRQRGADSRNDSASSRLNVVVSSADRGSIRRATA